MQIDQIQERTRQLLQQAKIDKHLQTEMDIYEHVHAQNPVCAMQVLNYFDPELPDCDDCSWAVLLLKRNRIRYQMMLSGEEEWDGCDAFAMIRRIDQWLVFLKNHPSATKGTL